MLTKDEEIMTSLRWMSRVKPHAIYKYIRETKGWNVSGLVIIVVFQLCYTTALLFLSWALWRSQLANQVWLVVLLAYAVRNGAHFYFKVIACVRVLQHAEALTSKLVMCRSWRIARVSAQRNVPRKRVAPWLSRQALGDLWHFWLS